MEHKRQKGNPAISLKDGGRNDPSLVGTYE
jgi:hypothetical protein